MEIVETKQKVQYRSRDWYQLSSLLAWVDYYKQKADEQKSKNNSYGFKYFMNKHIIAIEQINALQNKLTPLKTK